MDGDGDGAIERIERSERKSGPGLAPGALLGMAGGVAFGLSSAYVVGFLTGNTAAAYATLIGVSLGGAYLGATAMGRYSEWVESYPEHR